MESTLVKSASRRPWVVYGVAVAAAVFALLIRMPFLGLLDGKVPYVTFFLATAASAAFGGLGPGLVTTILGAILAGYFVVPPVDSLLLGEPADYLGLALFIVVSAFISFQAGRLLNATRHENALRLLFQQTLSSIGDAIISTDDQKRVRLMNPVAERLTGWTQAEAKGRPITEVFRIANEGSDAPAEVPVDRILQTGMIIGLANHTDLITKAGERIPIDDNGAPVRDEHGRVAGAVLVFRDIADRRRTERELAAAELRTRNILENITEGFILLDQEWRYVQVNPSAESMMATSAASLAGKVYWDQQPGTWETPMEILFRRSMAEGVPVQFENYYRPTGRWFHISAYPSADGLAVYFRDITERRRSEAALVELNEDLKQFTFAATHDLREPLRMITVYAEMLHRKLGDQLNEQTAMYMANVLKGAERISRLLDGLLQFSRMGEITPEPYPIDSEAALKQALDDLEIVVMETHAKVTYEPLPAVMGETPLISQVFQNLIGNALKYGAPGFAPEIHIYSTRDDANCILAVRDNGMGIAPEYQSQIFLPFKRLHGSKIAGAGIGLATCKRIVERYGGKIWVESQTGHGSTFYFSLPAADSARHAGGN